LTEGCCSCAAGSGINAITFVVGKGLHSDNGDAVGVCQQVSGRVGGENVGCYSNDVATPVKEFSELAGF